jgi:hypothetical protein
MVHHKLHPSSITLGFGNQFHPDKLDVWATKLRNLFSSKNKTENPFQAPGVILPGLLHFIAKLGKTKV